MAFLDDFTPQAAAATDWIARPGYVLPMLPRADHLQLREPAIALDQEQTDLLIETELWCNCPRVDLDDLAKLIPRPISMDGGPAFLMATQDARVIQGRRRGEQRGGIHSDPMLRVIAANQWARRDVEFHPHDVRRENARVLSQELRDRSGHPRAVFNRRNEKLLAPLGLYEIAPEVSLDHILETPVPPPWPASNWPFVYRAYLQGIAVKEYMTDRDGNTFHVVQAAPIGFAAIRDYQPYPPMQNIPVRRKRKP